MAADFPAKTPSERRNLVRNQRRREKRKSAREQRLAVARTSTPAKQQPDVILVEDAGPSDNASMILGELNSLGETPPLPEPTPPPSPEARKPRADIHLIKQREKLHMIKNEGYNEDTGHKETPVFLVTSKNSLRRHCYFKWTETRSTADALHARIIREHRQHHQRSSTTRMYTTSGRTTTGSCQNARI